MTLQEKANEILTRTSLVTALSQFGETHVVGNVAFSTTTRPDIDIQIYCDLHYEDAVALIIDELTKLGFTDIKGRRLKKSNKFLILGKINYNGENWDLDVTLTQPDTNYLKDSYRFFLDYEPKMTDEKKELIIGFKERFSKEKISGDNSSYYIYLGVLDENIDTFEGMEKYIRKLRHSR